MSVATDTARVGSWVGSPRKKTLDVGIVLLVLAVVATAALITVTMGGRTPTLSGTDPQIGAEWGVVTVGPTAAEISRVGLERGRILNELYGLNGPSATQAEAFYLGVMGFEATVPGGVVGNVAGLPEMADLPAATLPPATEPSPRFEDRKHGPR